MREITHTLTPEQQKALLDQPDACYPVELRNHLILTMALNVGLRLCEQTILRWKHVDVDTGRISITFGTGMKQRELEVPDETHDLVARWKEQQQREWEKRTCPSNPLNEKPVYIFTTLRGKRIKRTYIKNMVNGNAKAAGIKRKVTYQTLRRTYARRVYQQTKNWRHVQRKLGHEDVATTIRFVCKDLDPERLLPVRISSPGHLNTDSPNYHRAQSDLMVNNSGTGDRC